MKGSKQRKLLLLALIAFFSLSMVTHVSGYNPSNEEITANEMSTENVRAFCMTIAVGISSITAGWAVVKTSLAAIGSITEKPELFGSTIIYVGLAEGIAIYGLLVSFLLWIGFGG